MSAKASIRNNFLTADIVDLLLTQDTRICLFLWYEASIVSAFFLDLFVVMCTRAYANNGGVVDYARGTALF